jgi:hypothetical protein
MLASLLPTVPVGNAQLIERDALSTLLDRLAASDDPARDLASLRQQPKPPVVRRKIRQFIRTDVQAGATGLPVNVAVPEPGLMIVRYADMEDLATALHGLARLLEDDLEGFAALYEPDAAQHTKTLQDELESQDAAFIREWLQAHPLQ